MIRLLLSAWPLFVGLLLFVIGFLACCVFCAGPSLTQARDERDAWRRRALTAEANQRNARLAPVLPLTYAASVADQRRGLRVVHGGRR